MRWIALVLLLAFVGAGCGGSKPAGMTTAGGSTSPGTSTSPGALQAEANAAATGDVPDNQKYIGFTNHAAGYSIKYPEGWAQQGSGGTVTFKNNNNLVRIVVGPGATPTLASVRADVAKL